MRAHYHGNASTQRISPSAQLLRGGLAAGRSRRLFDGHREAGARSVTSMMGITEMARRVSGGGFVVLEDASEDVAVDDLFLLSGGGA